MGNCPRKESCACVPCCWATASSSPTHQPALSQGPGPATTSSSQGNSAPSPVPSAHDLIANLARTSQGVVTDVTDFEEILKYMDQILSNQGSTPHASVQIPELISANMEDAENALVGMSTLCDNMDGSEGILDEITKVLGDAFHGVGNLHWIAAAFSMVAFVLKRLDQMTKNEESCRGLLESLRQFGKDVVKLFKVLPDKNDEFQEAATLITAAAFYCASHMNASFAKRFTFVNVPVDKISNLKERITNLHQHLNHMVHEENLRRLPTPLGSYEGDHPNTNTVGREQMINDILGVLQQTQETFQPILLYGMGGIGKTTIGEAIVSKSSARFHKVAKVELGENPSSTFICQCQSTICERLSGSKQSVGDLSEGQRLLRHHFKQSAPILLFVDNVFAAADLERLLPKDLHLVSLSNSYILVTSRNALVLEASNVTRMKWKKYDVKELTKPDARKLLASFLEGCLDDSKRKEQFEKILNICGGWPLAIEVAGSHLRSKKDDDQAWQSTIKQLSKFHSVSNIPNDKVKMILEWSYSQMDENCKNVFLDVCCLFRNEYSTEARALGTGSELDTLKALSLVKRVQRSYRITHNSYIVDAPDRIGAHDLVVALGQQKNQQGSPSKKTLRICWKREDSFPRILEDGTDESEYEHVEGLRLTPGGLLGPVILPRKNLDAMHKSLRILWLDGGVRVQEKCSEIPFKLQICSVTQFPYKGLKGLEDLRVLRINEYEKESSINFDQQVLPKSLQILDLRGIRSLQTFHAQAFQSCDNLHTLHIHSCNQLQKLPAIIFEKCPLRELVLSRNRLLENLPGLSCLQSLEKFECSGSSLQEFPPGFAGLKNLRRAKITDFTELLESVDFGQISRLEYLEINYGRLQTLTEQMHHGFRDLATLRILAFKEWRSSRQLSYDLSQLTALEVLSFAKCDSLTKLPKLHKLLALRYLCLDGCKALQSLPEGFGELLALSHLYLNECKAVQSLPDGICQLKALKTLSLTGCESLERLPEGFGELIALSDLYLDGCKAVQSLPDGICQLKALKTLSLTGCESLEQLPQEFGKLLPLSKLLLDGCKALQSLPDGICQLKALKTLSLTGCESLERLPDGFSKLLALSYLRVDGCKALQSLPDGMCQLEALKTLSLTGCTSLRKVPKGFGTLPQLSTVEVGTMDNLEEWSGELSKLPSLRMLQFPAHASLNAFSNITSLETLRIIECETVTKLPPRLDGLASLISLTLVRCELLTELPSGLGNLSALTSLYIEGCKSLRRLPDDLSRVTSLERLSMTECEVLEELPSGFGNLLRLQYLKLDGCALLRRLPDGLEGLLSLRRVFLFKCDHLQDLPDSVCSLNNLQDLCLGGGFTKLPHNLGELTSLVFLDLYSCNKLVELPESISQLTNLKRVYLSNRSNIVQSEVVHALRNRGVSVVIR